VTGSLVKRELAAFSEGRIITMADRYHDRHFPAGKAYDRRDDQHAAAKADSDPLAELARLIGQSDPFAGRGRANLTPQPRAEVRDHYEEPEEFEEGDSPAGPPPWMQRVARQEAPQQDYPHPVHPVQRYAAPQAAPEPNYEGESYADEDQETDLSRYDDALYGEYDPGAEPAQVSHSFADDPYGDHPGYSDEPEEPAPKRGGGIVTVAAVLALAVVGTGAAFAYRTYVGAPRNGGDPPIIRADTSPTKIVPASAEATVKVPDRLASSDGTEKIVPREEAPVDVNVSAPPSAAPTPRMVFPALNPNTNPPSVASVAPNGPPPPSSGNGTLPSNQPRKIRTLSVRSDQADAAEALATDAPAPVPKAAATRAITPVQHASPVNANASAANAPLSLTPQSPPAQEPRTRVAATAPAASGGGGYLVQVSSQRNEADAQASYRVLQGKFPSVLGSRSALIKRADLGQKGVYYRAMVGPFGTSEEASKFCGSLKTAGGQCVIQRN
jgi:sporulation related protein